MEAQQGTSPTGGFLGRRHNTIENVEFAWRICIFIKHCCVTDSARVAHDPAWRHSAEQAPVVLPVVTPTEHSSRAQLRPRGPHDGPSQMPGSWRGCWLRPLCSPSHGVSSRTVCTSSWEDSMSRGQVRVCKHLWTSACITSSDASVDKADGMVSSDSMLAGTAHQHGYQKCDWENLPWASSGSRGMFPPHAKLPTTS